MRLATEEEDASTLLDAEVFPGGATSPQRQRWSATRVLVVGGATLAFGGLAGLASLKVQREPRAHAATSREGLISQTIGAWGLPVVQPGAVAVPNPFAQQAVPTPSPYGAVPAPYPPPVATPAYAPAPAVATPAYAPATQAPVYAAQPTYQAATTQQAAMPAPAPPQQMAQSASSVGSSTSGCYEHSAIQYRLDWTAQGSTFFDEWNFLLNEPNSGAAQYLTKENALAQRVVEASEQAAIIRAGPKGDNLKRLSAKLETSRKWKYFLATTKFSHVPWGCGVWPAFWTHSPDVAWPNGGELDILEFANEIGSRSSFHVGESNRCLLDRNELNKPGCATMPDAEYDFTGHYDCITAYPEHIGCAPNKLPLLNGQEMASQPSVVAVEWTEDYVKIFRIPEAEIPADLTSETPQPDTWDQWVVTYYPFAASERNVPGSCPNPANIMAEQQIVISLGFCGDWASKVWINSTMCANKLGGSPTVQTPSIPDTCVAVDPHNPKGETPGGPRDCCTQYIYDEDGTYGTEATLNAQAYFQIEWMKIFVPGR